MKKVILPILGIGGLLAVALAVAEVFKSLSGNPMAGDRGAGLSLRDPRML